MSVSEGDNGLKNQKEDDGVRERSRVDNEKEEERSSRERGRVDGARSLLPHTDKSNLSNYLVVCGEESYGESVEEFYLTAVRYEAYDSTNYTLTMTCSSCLSRCLAIISLSLSLSRLISSYLYHSHTLSLSLFLSLTHTQSLR